MKSKVDECDQQKSLSQVDVSEQNTSQSEADECNQKKSSGVDESKQKTSQTEANESEDKNSGVHFEIDAEVVFLIFFSFVYISVSISHFWIV